MSKLWTANICLDVEVVVAADDVNNAKCDLDINDVLSNCDSDVRVYWSEITSIDKIPHGWEGSEPYGDYTGNCRDMMIKILEEQEKEKNRIEMDKLQLKLDFGDYEVI